jgi:hypothetical protein
MTGAITRTLRPLTTTIPILAMTGDPVAGGIVTNLANSGGNITGVSTDAGLGIYGEASPVPCRDGAKAGKCAVPHDYNFALAVLRDAAGIGQHTCRSSGI